MLWSHRHSINDFSIPFLVIPSQTFLLKMQLRQLKKHLSKKVENTFIKKAPLKKTQFCCTTADFVIFCAQFQSMQILNT